MKFSIVFPTRDRIALLQDMLESVLKNTAEINEVEVLVWVDTDDSDTFKFLQMFQSKYTFMRYFSGTRSLNFSQDYYTYLAKQSSGRWIICANDDCQFETPQWDAIAYNILKDKPGVIYGYIEDGLGANRAPGHGNYCCFPLQGREGFEALGYIFPARIPTWGADIWAKGLYDQIGSNVTLPIAVRHYTSHNGTRATDHIQLRIATHQVKYSVLPTYEEINCLLKAHQKSLQTIGAK